MIERKALATTNQSVLCEGKVLHSLPGHIFASEMFYDKDNNIYLANQLKHARRYSSRLTKVILEVKTVLRFAKDGVQLA